MTVHLVIGDPHSETGISNERFDWLSKIIIDRRPDVIVCMGDFNDFPSLSSYDKGRKDFEGRRFNLDIETGKDALRRTNAEIDDYNERCKINKKAQYRPRKIMLGGNHDEGRIGRVVQLHAEFEGMINIDQVGYKEYGWEYIPYTIPICIDGIWYCHHFPSGVKGEPISGVNVAQALLAKNMVSSVVGHNHVLDFAVRTAPSGKRVWGLSAGCYFTQSMKYAISTEHLWWKGLIFLHNVAEGDFDIETINIKEIQKRYG